MIIDYIAYLGVGAVAGVLAGLLGIGGGLVIVPVLVFLFRHQGMDDSIVMHLAIGSSLSTIVVTSLGSIRAHHGRGSVIWPVVASLTPGIVAGALLGAAVAELLETLWLQRVFGVFVLSVAVQLLTSPAIVPHRNLPGVPGMLSAGGIIGTVSSLVGIGGGTLTVPFLTWHRIAMVKAVGTSSACGLPIALAGTIGFLVSGWGNPALPQAATGYLFWPAIIGIVLTSFLMTSVGAALAHRLPVTTLKRVFALFLIVVGIRLLVG